MYAFGLKLDSQSSIGLEVKRVRQNPGAGTYNPDFSKTSKFNGAYSIKSRFASKEIHSTPGPGAYS
jgi:hypothetical protein